MGSNSISNNSNNIRVNSNYTNKKYGSTIGKSGGSSQAALASRARTANTEEFDLSSPTVIVQKENMVKKSEIIEQIENLISFFDNSKKTLEEEKENLIKKSKSFTDSANRGEYPELYWEENVKGRKKYLNPKEAIKSDKYFKKYLKDNGYPTDRERMSSEKYNSLKEEYANYINTAYTEKYNEYFSKALDMSYEKYVERLTQLSCEIEQLKASRYEMLQRLKEQPYIELMDTDDFKNYVANNKDNPNSELYKLYGIKNGTITMDDDSYWRFKYFTEQDMLIFSYLWDMQSPKAAREYVDAIEDKLNKVEGYANAEKFLDSIRDENGNIDPDVRAGVLSGAKGFENGVSTFFDGLGNAFSDEGMMSTTQYEQMYILNELTNSSGNYISKLANEIYAEQGEEVANDFLKKMYNSETNEIDLEYAKTMLSEQEYNNLIIKIDTDKKSRLDNVYELGSSFGNMAPTLALSIAVSFVAPGAGITIAGKTFAFNTLISSGLMGLSAGGNAKNQALMQGNDLYISTVYGLASGFSETSLGLLLGNIPGLSATAEFSIIGLLKEGGEEALQEGVDALLRSVLLGETIDYDQLPKDMIKSFCYGVIMSGITNGGKFAFSIAMGNETIKINSMDDFLNFVKNNVVGLPSAQVESDVVDITHSNDNVVPSIDETVEQSSSINPNNLDIDNQIAMANYHTDKGLTTTIDIDSVSSLTESQINSIKNVDNVIFRLPDGSSMSISQLLNARLNLSGKTISGTANVSMDLDSQIARANMYTNKGNFASIDVPDISMMTDEVLSKIDNVDNVRFRLQDGSVIDIASLLNKRNSAKMDSVLSEVSSKTSSTISSNIESQIASITIQTEKGNSSSISYSKGVSLAQYVKQYLSSNMRKFLYKDTSNFVGLNEQIMQNGLYHFTTNVDNIIASGYIKASDFIASYASPLSPTLKSFFFNGIPEVGAVATNLDSVPVKATAIKIDPTPELVQSSKLKLRYMDDMAITYDGNFNLDGYNVQKCFFGLDIEDGKLVYKSISEAEYQNYENTSAGKMLSDYVSDKKNLIAIKSDFFTKIFGKNGISNIIDNGVDIDNSQIDGIMSETKQSSVSSDSSIGESKVQTSSINPSNLDIDNQIAMANYHTDKGLTTTIDIDSVSSLTESQINSIKNVDNVLFRLPDGSSMNIFQLLEERSYILNKPISEMIKTFKDINVQIKEANIRIKSGDTALIDVSDVTVLTEEVLSKIENVDDVTFRMPDGSTFKIDDVRTIRDKFNKVRYRKKVHFAINEILKKANPKLVELYDMGKKTGRGILGFRGYEEHNYLHVVRVANESVSVLKKFNSILDGTANGVKLGDRLKISQYYGKISEDIIYYAGLAHDLGMILRTYSKYKLKTIDAEGIVRQEFQKVGKDTIETKLYEKVFNTLISDVIRKNHALGSAIIVLKENLFGTNNEMISVLAALHSKSSSGVKDLLNENAVKDVILDLYNNRENCGYNFDISKFGTLTEVVNSDGTIKQVFDIDNEVLKQIRTGTYALRLGDAHAEKTGFNHGGGMFKIDKVPLPLSENSYADVKEFDNICFDEIKDAAVSVEYLDDGTIQVISGDTDVSGDRGFEFSKRVIFGERNVYPVQTEVRDGHMVYIQEVKTTNTPACTVEHGIIEKFGEYNTATGIPQDVLVVLPEDTPEYIFRYYRERLAVAKATKYGNINKIEIKWQNEIYPADLDKN